MYKKGIHNILLRGYYGFGNFGDDLLMIATYNIITEVFPSAKVSIFTFSKDGSYIKRLLPKVEIVSQNNIDDKYDLIVHGGGGVYFDFQKGPFRYLLLNTFIKIIGIRFFAGLLRKYRVLKGMKVEKTKKRVGIGIGVGKYTKSSTKLLNSTLAISDYDLIMLRDKKSIKNFRRYNHHTSIIEGTDLIFGPRFWMNDSFKEKGEVISFVIRELEDSVINEQLLNVARKFTNNEVKFFLFDKNADSPLYQKISAEFDVNVWDPLKISFQDYIKELALSSLIITSRAHGAIVGAGLNISSIIIGIEPKLETIHKMLPTSSRYIPVEAIDDKLEKEINYCISHQDKLGALVRNDAEMNAAKLYKSLDPIIKFLKTEC